jgi:hypothetical protein
MSGLRQALTPSSLSRSRRTGSLLELAIAFFLDLIDAVFITISPSIYSCSNRAPCGPPMTPPELLGSLGGGAKAPLVLHHHMMHRRQAFCLLVITAWSIASKLELALHHVPSAVTSHPTRVHHEPRDTSNARNIINHSSSKGDHHWSSASPI